MADMKAPEAVLPAPMLALENPVRLAIPAEDTPPAARTTRRSGSHDSLFGLRSCFLFLRLLEVFCPRRDHANHSGIGDQLSQMFGTMADDEDQHAAFGILRTKPVHALFEIRIVHVGDC